MIEKKTIRKEFKAKRELLKKTDLAADGIIYNTLINENIFKEAKCIFCYLSFGTEIDTYRIIDHILEAGKKLVVPKCTTAGGDMIAVELKSRDELKDGMYGIKEPVSDIPYDKEGIDLAIIPALAFDTKGFRLGYGKGYYDRFLADTDMKTIGICHKELLVTKLPHNEFDISVDKVITG